MVHYMEKEEIKKKGEGASGVPRILPGGMHI
jgi:hypothetical protein